MPNPVLPEHLPITVEARDETGRIVEMIARCANVTVARGAFEAAMTCRQGVGIMIRDRARVVAEEFIPRVDDATLQSGISALYFDHGEAMKPRPNVRGDRP